MTAVPAPLLLLAIALGLIGVVYEFCAPGSIWPGALGGLLATVAIYRASATNVELPRAWLAGIGIPTALILFFLISTAVRAGRNKQFLDDDSYLHELGVAITDVRENSGTVRVRDAQWHATSSTAIAAGTEIVVDKKAGQILHVHPR